MTTSALALLLSWPLAPGRRVVMVECDPDGGAVLFGMLQGALGDQYGLRNLSVAARRGDLEETFWRQLIDVTDDGRPDPLQDRLVLPGLLAPEQAAGMAPAWEQLAQLCRRIEQDAQQPHDVLLDLGRRGAFGASSVLARTADVLLVVARSTLRGVRAAQSRLEALRGQFGELGVLLVEEGPYRAAEVERALNAPVVAALPYRPQQAVVLSDGAPQPRQFERSELMRAGRVAATPVLQRAAMRRTRLAGAPGPGSVGAWEVSGRAR
ncbi:hypothetical protein [Streptomyces lydicus]|uniref:hypothetical protein n=1 Tax=Streptomyces lydicus TaxID=47763 RepID=UPI0036E656E6